MIDILLWFVNSINGFCVNHLKVKLIWVPECSFLPEFP